MGRHKRVRIYEGVGDSNENVKKGNRLNKLNNNSARASPLFCQFFCSSLSPPQRPVGNLSNDDGDGNENVKKVIGLSKTIKLALASRFFVHFSTASARLRRENA